MWPPAGDLKQLQLLPKSWFVFFIFIFCLIDVIVYGCFTLTMINRNFSVDRAKLLLFFFFNFKAFDIQ